MAQMECGKDFACYKSGFEKVSKARDDGLEGYVWCLEEEMTARGCDFAVCYGRGVLCKCPLRIYLAKKLGKCTRRT
jgi:hypothetical protein